MLERTDRQALLAELELAGAVIKNGGREIRCPFHDDQHASGGVFQDDAGVWRYKCHGGSCGFSGDLFDIRAKAQGRPLAEVLKENRPARQGKAPPQVFESLEAIQRSLPGRLEATYTYTNPQTRQPDLIVLRYRKQDGSKSFCQVSQTPDGLVKRQPPGLLPLYNRTKLAEADTVIVVEGEKCVHALRTVGLVATTAPMGAGNAGYTDWTPLAGKKCILWPDADVSGHNHMDDVERILSHLEPAPFVSVLDPADLDLTGKEDAADHVQQLETALQGNKDEIKAWIQRDLAKARPRSPTAGLSRLIEDSITGKRQAVALPWPALWHLTQALLPGTVTILAGGVGASKSFMVLQLAAFWHSQGIKLALYELEEDQTFHLSRALAQRSSTSGITDAGWLKENPDEARRLYAEHQAWLDGFQACIHASPASQPTLKQLAGWVAEQAEAGCRLVCLDPITVGLHTTRTGWEEDLAFLCAIKKSATDHGCSVVCVTHPVKTASAVDLTQLAGGASFQRFAQTILWLESHDSRLDNVVMACGTVPAFHDRTLHCLKVRNGKGHGARLAFAFKAESLTLAEVGLIAKARKTSKKQERRKKASDDSETEESDGWCIRKHINVA